MSATIVHVRDTFQSRLVLPQHERLSSRGGSGQPTSYRAYRWYWREDDGGDRRIGHVNCRG
ncbi:hypothetical protein DV733_10160 [Halapricum salinum]|uniref:Uncharacterized protein n=1 Tax=Halapricum salinum TaxID=1457250 RepID=A0A4D6HEU7_9EURY|nr:hypothetical protein DV733_10160 [Halapricum salinum]